MSVGLFNPIAYGLLILVVIVVMFLVSKYSKELDIERDI